jgi:hypothetical protein
MSPPLLEFSRVAFTVSFPTSGPLPEVGDLAAWLTEQGEPFEHDASETITLRALPVRIVHEGDAVRAQVEVTPTLPLSRLVRLLFDLSVRVGADVRLAGVGEINRAGLWLKLADEQDRQRLATALGQAGTSSHRDEIFHELWSLLSCLGDGADLRWDAASGRIVELKEVGTPGGLTVDEAAWHAERAAPGDQVAVPVVGRHHLVAWRWLVEAWPNLLENR